MEMTLVKSLYSILCTWYYAGIFVDFFCFPFTASFSPLLTDTGWGGGGGCLSWDELDDGDTFPMAERKPPER
jgi:hypothetical protein